MSMSMSMSMSSSLLTVVCCRLLQPPSSVPPVSLVRGPACPPDEAGAGGGHQPSCHISTSRSCPAPTWGPSPLQETSASASAAAHQNSVTSSYSINQRLNNQLSVDSARGAAPPAYSERPGGDRGGERGGLTAPSFTSHNNIS